jgi:hypothetical protein
MSDHNKPNNIKLLKISFWRADVDRFFIKELGIDNIMDSNHYRNALLRIRDKRNYPNSLDMKCEFDSGFVDITFCGLDFVDTESGYFRTATDLSGKQKKKNYTDEEFFEDVKEFSNLINQCRS